MLKDITVSSLPVYIKFIIFISFIEISFNFLFKIIGMQVFQMIPYTRLVVLLFTGLFFFNLALKNKNLFNLSIVSNSENILMVSWMLLTILGCIIGIIHLNPLLYFITDFIYVFFGYIIYRIFLTDSKIRHEISIGLDSKQEKKLIFYFLLISFISFLLSIEMPSFFVIFSLVYTLYFFGLKKYKEMAICTLPFLLQVLTANRALLLVYIFILFFYITQNKFSKKNIINLLIFIFILLILISFFIQDLLKLIINILPENSIKLRNRLVQIYLIFSGKANWNSASMLSLKQRIDEANIVISFWLSNPLTFLFGGGMGATMDGYAFKDAGVGDSALLGKSAIHNIHLLPFSLIFRYGFFGLVIFSNILYNFFKYFVRIITSNKSQFTIFVSFQFCWILYSMSAASYLWTCPFFWITLAYLSNEKKILNS